MVKKFNLQMRTANAESVTKTLLPSVLSETEQIMEFKTFFCKLLLPVVIISFGGGFHYGYQVAVINPSQESFRSFINASYFSHYGSSLTVYYWTYLWTSIVIMQSVGGFIGTFFVRCLLEKLGRKRSLYVAISALFVTCIPQGVAKPLNCWELFMVGRFLQGVAQGTILGLQPVYFTEICPAEKRGLIGAMTGFIIAIGFLFSSVVAMPIVLGDEGKWPYLFLVQAIFIVPALILLPFLPESPKFLASREDFDGAESALRFFGRTETEIKKEMQEIRQELNKISTTSGKSMPVKTLFSTPYVRKGVFLGWVVIFSAAFSGIMALSLFSTHILETSGLSSSHAQYSAMGIGVFCFLGSLLSSVILDRFGRRPIILAANTTLLILNILFIIFANQTRVNSATWAAYANIAVALLINFTYGLGPANILWFLTAELVPQGARSTAHTLAMMARWISTGTASLIFFPLQQAVKEFCFLLHVVPLLLSIIYFGVALPETKNKTPLEIMRKLGYHDEDDSGVNRDIPTRQKPV